MEKHYVFKSLFADNITQVNGDKQNAEDYAEMHVALGVLFAVFLQFEGDEEASCSRWMQ